MAKNDGGGGGKSQDQETEGNRKTSGKAFLGYEFNKAFSLEAGYVDLGKHDTSGGATVREREPFIEAIVHFASSESFSPFLKGGVHRLEVETHTPVLTEKKEIPTRHGALGSTSISVNTWVCGSNESVSRSQIMTRI